MDDASIQEIVKEISPLLIDRAPGKIFQFGANSFAIDFGLRDHGDLLISVDSAQPRLYLIKRRVRDLEKQSVPLTQFALTLRKELAGTQAVSVEKDPEDRLVRVTFAGYDELGKPKERVLLAQLTGRSANLFVLDKQKLIIHRARANDISGQQIGDHYQAPAAKGAAPASGRESKLLKQIQSGEFDSPSAAADAYFTSLLQEKTLATQVAAARAEIRKRIAQQQKLLKQLQRDLDSHRNGEQHKRLGDLLLANLSTAKRSGNRLTLIDYFADDAGPIDIELDESVPLQEEASRCFELYSRSKRAVTQITTRIEAVRKQLNDLEAKAHRLEKEIAMSSTLAAHSESRSVAIADRPLPSAKPKRIPGTRRYLSSDDFEILVGRTAKDNDNLTFKIAKPNDVWLHAADYGGSHVVVRNTTRKPIPHRTLIEAAQLTAWFSQAKKDPKVDVHYTERKFVSKIKGGKPGLVRLQRFRNVTVEPKEAGIRE